jgi:hypothetical protein
MIEPTLYPYSFKFSLATLAAMIIVWLLPLRNVMMANTAIVWVVYCFCSLVLFSLAVVIVMKRLVPSLRGDVALQLDDEGLGDYVKEVSIKWKDIKEIHFIRGRSASIIRVDLKWESNYGSQIAIYLRWIKGKDSEIYETTMAYFEHCVSDPED